jgi:hypothetical protein
MKLREETIKRLQEQKIDIGSVVECARKKRGDQPVTIKSWDDFEEVDINSRDHVIRSVNPICPRSDCSKNSYLYLFGDNTFAHVLSYRAYKPSKNPPEGFINQIEHPQEDNNLLLL